jgi:ribonuclease H / adenosylcobalamin/alpha-ribazole phosphatase
VGRLLLVRHAESEGNRDRVFARTPEVGITERGCEQARQVGEWLREHYAPVRVVSSPYRRARQTAAEISASTALDVHVEDDLRERSYGHLAGQPYDTPRPDYDPAAYWSWRPPGGETLEEVVVRVGRVLDRLACDAVGHDLVVVSHGAVMIALWRHVTGDWSAPGRVVRNAGVVLVEHTGDRYLRAEQLDGP